MPASGSDVASLETYRPFKARRISSTRSISRSADLAP